MVNDWSLNQWRKGQITRKRYTKFWFCEDNWRIQIRKSLNIYASDSDQSKNVKDWNSNGYVGDGSAGLNLPPLQPGGRQKNGRNGRDTFSRVAERTTVICFLKELRLQAVAIPLQAAAWKQHTAPRASITCHTQSFSSCARCSRWLMHSVECSPCVRQKSFLIIHVPPDLAWPAAVLTFLHFFSNTCTWFVWLSLAVTPVDDILLECRRVGSPPPMHIPGGARGPLVVFITTGGTRTHREDHPRPGGRRQKPGPMRRLKLWMSRTEVWVGPPRRKPQTGR